MRVRRTPALGQWSIRTIYRLWSVHRHQAQETLKTIRSISSNKASYTQASNKIGRSCSSSRTKSICSWINRRLMQRQRSKWNRNISNKRNNCSKHTRSRPSKCNRGSHRPRTRLEKASRSSWSLRLHGVERRRLAVLSPAGVTVFPRRKRTPAERTLDCV